MAEPTKKKVRSKKGRILLIALYCAIVIISIALGTTTGYLAAKGKLPFFMPEDSAEENVKEEKKSEKTKDSINKKREAHPLLASRS